MGIVETLIIFICGVIAGAHSMSVRWQIKEIKRLTDEVMPRQKE